MAGVVLRAPFPKRTRAAQAMRNGFRYLVNVAVRNWFRNFGSTGPALGTMTMLLFLSGVVGLLGVAAHNLASVESRDAALLHVYLRDDATGKDVTALRTILAADPRVKSVTYVSKQEALARAQRRPGLPDLATASDSNPFPASFDVQVGRVEDVGAVNAEVLQSPAVDPIFPSSYDAGAYQKIQNVLLGMTIVGLGFLALLGFIAVTVTANSIRAAIHARRDEIKIMQLVGAPRWMVRGPFVVEGLFTGGLAGAIAGLLTFGICMAAIQAGASTFAQFAPGVTVLVAVLAGSLIFFIGLGLGSGASILSLRRHLES